MVITVGICDDEEVVCNQLSVALRQYATAKKCSFELSVFHSGQELLRDIKPDMQILFLDISMNGLTGIEVARKLRETSPEIRVIFITSMVQYAVEGYSVHAFGFLSKPISFAALERQMDDTIRSLVSTSGKKLAIHSGGNVELIPSNDILYIESFAHQLKVSNIRGQMQCAVPMKQMEETLKDCGFFRCHKCYLVNFRHILRVDDRGCILDNQEHIPVSRHRRQEFLQEFNRFIGVWM